MNYIAINVFSTFQLSIKVTIMKHALIIVLLTVGALRPGEVFADDLSVTFREIAGDVTATADGSLDLFGLVSSRVAPFNPSGVAPSNGFFQVGSEMRVGSDLYFTAADGNSSGPLSFGFAIEEGITNATSGTGDVFGITTMPTLYGVYVPLGYVSGESITSESLYADKSFIDLGLIPGSYSWALGQNTVTLDVVSVPEPAAVSCTLFITTVAWAKRRRRRWVN